MLVILLYLLFRYHLLSIFVNDFFDTNIILTFKIAFPILPPQNGYKYYV
jgi:hypothetical protein